MSVRVITASSPIVTPADIAGDHAADDATIATMIAAVTAKLDAPRGWLGRSLGQKTLEWTDDCWGGQWFRLLFPPVASPVSVKYVDVHGVEQTVSPDDYELIDDAIWFHPSWRFPALYRRPDAVRIRYQAGYAPTDVPPEAKQAVILSVQHLMAMSREDLYLRAEEVEGIGRDEYAVSEQASKIIERAADQLLQGLRLYS